MERFFAAYERLLQSLNFKTYRYLYKDFNLDSRLTGLIGPRGTGKTTLLLQYIKNRIEDREKCIYVSMDNIYFSETRLVDFVNELYEVHGIRYFFLDEVHKYPNWNQELKNIYDTYPDVKTVFSGSSSIDLIKGTYDLSRRAVIFRIYGLSFREYLHFRSIISEDAIEFEELLDNKRKHAEKIGSTEKLRGSFRQYLSTGYYPFFLEDESTYAQKLLRIVDKTIYEDIVNHYTIKTKNLPSFKRILAYTATIPPGELSINSISRNIGLDNKTVVRYLHMLEETGLLTLISSGKTGSSLLKQTEKIYLDNSNLYEAITAEIGSKSNIGSIREIFFVSMIKNSGHQVHYSRIGDFEVRGTVFEVGGRNKSLKQIGKNLNRAYLVKDDILYGGKHEIPLYLFGFLY